MFDGFNICVVSWACMIALFLQTVLFHTLFLSQIMLLEAGYASYQVFIFLLLYVPGNLSLAAFLDLFQFTCTQHLLRRRRWHPTPALLPGKSHGWRSLVGCSPWGHEESDMTERLHFHFSLSCIGEGNGNPLQCSCLEHSRGGRAWWAAVYGVAQSRTRLKWLRQAGSAC